MTIYVFVIDNTATMAQVAYNGATALDIGKSVVDIIMKTRSREHAKDRFMLISCDEYPHCIKGGWRESATALGEQLKRLRPTGTVSLETAVGRAFWYIALSRVNLDSPGYGIKLHQSDPAVVIVVTDAFLIDCVPRFVPEKIPHAYSEFFVDPHRSDARVFGLILRFPNRNLGPQMSKMEADRSPLSAFCTSTGGASFLASNPRQLNLYTDYIVGQTKIIGNRISLSYNGPDLENNLKNGKSTENGTQPPRPAGEELQWKQSIVGVHRMPRNDRKDNLVFNWVLPEAFWPDSKLSRLPPRPLYPEILFSYDPSPKPDFKDANLYDRFEIEYSPVSKFILSRRELGGTYPIYVNGSSRMSGLGWPCGFMVAEEIEYMPGANNEITRCSKRWTVLLYITLYNYAAGLPLVYEASKTPGKPCEALRQSFNQYLGVIPFYYYASGTDRGTFRTMLKAYNVLADQKSLYYNPHMSNSIAVARAQLKAEMDESISLTTQALNRSNIEANALSMDEVSPRNLNLHDPLGIPSTISQSAKESERDPLTIILERDPRPAMPPSAYFKRPTDICREEIIDYLAKMRFNCSLFGRDNDLHVMQGGLPGDKIKLHDAVDLHSRPIEQMGSYAVYEERLRAIGYAEPRKVFEGKTKSNAFGNPFKLDKKNLGVDEVPEDAAAPDGSIVRSCGQKTGPNRKTNFAAAFTKLRYRKSPEISSVASSPCPSPSYLADDDDTFAFPGLHRRRDDEDDSGIDYPPECPASPSPSLINGFNRLGLKRSISDDDDETETTDDDASGSEPSSPMPVKRRRESSGSGGGLSYRHLQDKAVEAIRIIRDFYRRKPEVMDEKFNALLGALTLPDQEHVILVARDSAVRLANNRPMPSIDKLDTLLKTVRRKQRANSHSHHLHHTRHQKSSSSSTSSATPSATS